MSARRKWNDWVAPKLYGREHNRLLRENVVCIVEQLLTMNRFELKEIVKKNNPTLVWVLARVILNAGYWGDMAALDKVLARAIGNSNQPISLMPSPSAFDPNKKASFEEFCERAGYPQPYEPQIEMQKFGIFETVARLLLGSRGYGKTDYVVILGIAYLIYLDPATTVLIITKSSGRNAAIVSEIAKALTANGVALEKENQSCLRVAGLKGKDHSVDAVTVGTTSLRGRHPRKIFMDDPVTEEDVSEATRKRVQRVYNEASKLTPDICIIGQPVHKFDLYETLRPILKKMEVPHGTIPELDHDLDAQRLAGVSEESIQASYFLKVISETGFPFEKVSYLDTFPKNESSVAFIDPSFEGGDYTAVSIVTGYFEGIAVKGRVFKKAWYDCLDDMEKEFKKCNVQRVCIETNALGEQPVKMLRDLSGTYGVVGKKSTGFKHSRIMAAGPFAKSIHIAKDSDRIYIDQVTKYEYGAKNDDAPDSLASCMEWIGLIRGKI